MRRLYRKILPRHRPPDAPSISVVGGGKRGRAPSRFTETMIIKIITGSCRTLAPLSLSRLSELSAPNQPSFSASRDNVEANWEPVEHRGEPHNTPVMLQLANASHIDAVNESTRVMNGFSAQLIHVNNRVHKASTMPPIFKSSEQASQLSALAEVTASSTKYSLASRASPSLFTIYTQTISRRMSSSYPSSNHATHGSVKE